MSHQPSTTSYRRSLRLSIAVLTALAVIPTGVSLGDVEYGVTDLGTLGGDFSHAYGLSDTGTVVGQAKTSSGAPHAFIEAPDANMLDLGTIWGDNSQANGISSDGSLVAGRSYAGGNEAFVWTQSGGMQGIGFLPGMGGYSTAAAVSGDGSSVVGWAAGGPAMDSYVWAKNTGMNDIGALPGATTITVNGHPFSGSNALGLSYNGSGIVGLSTTSTGNVHGFLYTNNAWTDIAPLPGDDNGVANAINQSGQIVGYSTPGQITFNALPTGNTHAFVDTNGIITGLGTLGGASSQANAINNAGQIVGSSDTAISQSAFIYANGSMHDLNTLVNPSVGVTLQEATAINSSGQIAVNGTNSAGQQRAYLLTPIGQVKTAPVTPPPPAPITLTPEQPVVTATPEKKTLIYIAHGWNANAAGWADGMASQIANQLSANIANSGSKESSTIYNNTPPNDKSETLAVGNYIIFTDDWSKYSGYTGTPLPSESPNVATSFAKELGTSLGKGLSSFISANNVGTIHFIGHSAGAWLISNATDEIKNDPHNNVTVQDTFLDPYLPDGKQGVDTLGSAADFSDEYSDSRDHIGEIAFGSAVDVSLSASAQFLNGLTGMPLTHAYDVNVSGRDPSLGLANPVHNHQWPYNWYKETIADVGQAGPEGEYGAALSSELGTMGSKDREGQVNVLPSLPNQYVPSSTADSTPAYLLRTDPPVTFNTPFGLTISPTGTVVASGTSLHLFTSGSAPQSIHSAMPASTTAADSVADLPDSTVWMAGLVSVDNLTNFITFDADFTSAAGSEGLLSVYWDDSLLGSIDERYVLDGTQSYNFDLPGAYDNNSFTLAFRLDSYTDTASSVNIDNVQTGYFNINAVPEPTTLGLMAFATVGLMRRRRR